MDAAISSIKTALRVATRFDTFSDSVLRLCLFGHLFRDLPVAEKHAKDPDPEVILVKVLGICNIRGAIRQKRPTDREPWRFSPIAHLNIADIPAIQARGSVISHTDKLLDRTIIGILSGSGWKYASISSTDARKAAV